MRLGALMGGRRRVLMERAFARVLLALPVVAACASATSQEVRPATEAPPAVIAAGGGTNVRFDAAGEVVNDEIYAPIAEAWPALAGAFQALGLEVSAADARAYTLRSVPARAPRRIDGKRLTELFDCGQTIGGARAELWEVTLEVVTVLRSVNPARSRVSSLETALARPREGTSTDPVPCRSKGELERIIVRRLAERT